MSLVAISLQLVSPLPLLQSVEPVVFDHHRRQEVANLPRYGQTRLGVRNFQQSVVESVVDSFKSFSLFIFDAQDVGVVYLKMVIEDEFESERLIQVKYNARERRDELRLDYTKE